MLPHLSYRIVRCLRIAFSLLLPLAGLASLRAAPEPITREGEVPRARLEFRTGRNNYTLTVQGRTREFIVHVPAGYTPATPTPVVFMFHGTNQDGNDMYLNSGWVEKANAERFIAVFPTSLSYVLLEDGVRSRPTKWNHVQLYELLADPSEVPADDEFFVRTILANVESTWNVDRRRIFASGFSNGGQFVGSRLMMTMPDIFSAFAVNGGGLDLSEVFPVRTDVSYFYVVGTRDDKILTGLGSTTSLPMEPADIMAHEYLGRSITARVLPRLALAATYDEVPGEVARFTTLVFDDRLTPGNTNEFRIRMVDGLAHRIPEFAPDLFWAFFLSHAGAARPLSGPPVISTQPRSQIVTTGRSATLITTVGSLTPPTYQWRFNGAAIAGATASSYSIPSAGAAHAGNYSVVVTNAAGAVTSSEAAITVAASSWLSNLSVRTNLATGRTLILGFVVNDGPESVLVRAAGPALTPLGVAGAMTDPRIELFQGATRIGENNDWAAAMAPTFASVGAFPFPNGSRDAAVEQVLTGSATLHTVGTGSGVVLVEAYDAGTNPNARFSNVSARNQVGTGDGILIAGFSIAGTGPQRLLIRAVGPSLAGFGVTGFLADPRVELFNSSGTKLGENDNWDPALAPVFAGVGAFPFTAGSRDAAAVVTLNAGGSFTVHVSGVNGGTGDALVELYALP